MIDSRKFRPPFFTVFGLTLAALAATRADAADVVCERDENGRVFELREVVLDDNGNYVNHGPWKRLTPDGKLALSGQFAHGLACGTWTHTIYADVEGRFPNAAWQQFKGPLISRADFVRGELHGTWTVVDQQQRTCTSIEFAQGKRHGTALWHAPDGTILRQEFYRNGKVEGDIVRYCEESGNLVHEGPHVQGYLLTPRVVARRPGEDASLQAVGKYALGPVLLEGQDDFWTSQLASSRLGDACLKHGVWKSWSPSGQLQFHGSYDIGRCLGRFTWWHPNGQKACTGQFADGNVVGEWTWWNSAGEKISERRLPSGDCPIAQQANNVPSHSPVAKTPPPSAQIADRRATR